MNANGTEPNKFDIEFKYIPVRTKKVIDTYGTLFLKICSVFGRTLRNNQKLNKMLNFSKRPHFRIFFEHDMKKIEKIKLKKIDFFRQFISQWRDEGIISRGR